MPVTRGQEAFQAFLGGPEVRAILARFDAERINLIWFFLWHDGEGRIFLRNDRTNVKSLLIRRSNPREAEVLKDLFWDYLRNRTNRHHIVHFNAQGIAHNGLGQCVQPVV